MKLGLPKLRTEPLFSGGTVVKYLKQVGRIYSLTAGLSLKKQSLTAEEVERQTLS